MIVRNGAATVERALRSVQSLARQIVVLDTGSEDDTPQRCLRLGAEVYFARWENDFAAARNAALRHVRMPWVLALDSDEELEAESLWEHAAVLEQEHIGAVEVEIRSVASEEAREPLLQVHWYPRLFRYAEGIAYVGRVHEQIRPAIEARGWQIMRLPIVIWHYGYAGGRIQEKARRNAELLQEELRAAPEDAWLRYHLGMALFDAGDSAAAWELLRESSECTELQPAQRLWARLRAAQAALQLERLEEVERLLSQPFPEPNLEGMRRFVLAAVRAHQRRFTDALSLVDSPVVKNCPYLSRGMVEEVLRSLRQLLGAQ